MAVYVLSHKQRQSQTREGQLRGFAEHAATVDPLTTTSTYIDFDLIDTISDSVAYTDARGIICYYINIETKDGRTIRIKGTERIRPVAHIRDEGDNNKDARIKKLHDSIKNHGLLKNLGTARFHLPDNQDVFTTLELDCHEGNLLAAVDALGSTDPVVLIMVNGMHRFMYNKTLYMSTTKGGRDKYRYYWLDIYGSIGDIMKCLQPSEVLYTGEASDVYDLMAKGVNDITEAAVPASLADTLFMMYNAFQHALKTFNDDLTATSKRTLTNCIVDRLAVKAGVTGSKAKRFATTIKYMVENQTLRLWLALLTDDATRGQKNLLCLSDLGQKVFYTLNPKHLKRFKDMYGGLEGRKKAELSTLAVGITLRRKAAKMEGMPDATKELLNDGDLETVGPIH